MKKQNLHIVKIGGHIINDPFNLNKVLISFNKLPHPKILIHGGGKMASEIEQLLGIKTQMINGRRITNEKSLKVVIMTYAGFTNKTIVAQLQALNANAIGLCGADMNIIQSEKRMDELIDYGYVGDIININKKAISTLLNLGLIPVINAITHNNKAQLLNTNADTIASKMAITLSDIYQVQLRYCYQYSGVLYDVSQPFKTINMIDVDKLKELKERSIIHSGMLVKLNNAISAKQHGVSEVSICGIENLRSQKNATWIK